MKSKTESAVNFYNIGFNCSQAVFAVFSEAYGIDEKTALKLSCGLGGGLRCGEVCGAVTGAALIIGMKYGHYVTDDRESKLSCSSKTLDFVNAFRNKNGSIICNEILSNVKGDDSKLHDLKREACIKSIRTAVELLEKQGY